MYFNTTNEEGGKLKSYQKKALTQDEKVLLIFQEKKIEMTPFQVLMAWKGKYNRPFPPLTSIRRAINTLTREWKLVKTNKKGVGAYGRPVHYWRLATEAEISAFQDDLNRRKQEAMEKLNGIFDGE